MFTMTYIAYDGVGIRRQKFYNTPIDTVLTPSTASTTTTAPSDSLIAVVTSSTKFTCPVGVVWFSKSVPALMGGL